MSSKDSKLSGTNPLPLSASSLPPSLATPTSPDHILPSSISPPLPRMNRRDTVPKRLSYGSSLSDLHSVHLNQHSSRLPVTTPSPEVDYYFPNNRIAASSQPVDPRSARSRWLPWLPWPSSPSSQTVLPMWNSPARSAACPPPAPPQLPSAVASPSRQSGKSSAPTPAPPGELELSLWVSDKTRSGSHPTLAYGINNGNAPPSMFDFMEAHILAALKRTSFSKFTLAFLDGETEEKYSAYFLDRSRYLWRTYAVISLLLCTLLQLLLTHFYPEIHFLGNPRSDFLLVLCGGTLPMLLLLMLHWKLPRSRLADCVPVLSLIFLLFLGPVQICGRQFINNPEKYPPSLTAPVYILVLLSSVFFFRIRFVYTVIGTLVSTVGWVAVFGAATREAVLKNPGDGLLTAFVCSSVGIILASVVTCFIAYDQERGFRLQYLSDQRFMRINTKLFKQLMGLQRSYISRIAADLDSPLEKAIMGLKYLMASPGVGAEHAPVLEMIMACLNSPNLMTPDLEHQVQRGQVDVDPEQEKWLFSEIARRKHSEPNASSAAAAAVAAVAARSVTPGPSTAAVNQATAPIGMMGSNASETTVATLVADLELGTSGDALEPGHNWISPLKWDDDRTTPTFMRDTPLPGLVALSPSPTSPYKTFDNTPAAIPEITKYCTSDALSMLQTSVNSWSFPIFAFHRSAREYPLMVMMHHLIVRSGLLTRLGIGSAEEVGKFMRFSKALEDGYHRDLMFHNSTHAADVLHSVHYLLSTPALSRIFNDLDRLSIYLAAAMHDVDHPGCNNAFLISTGDSKALVYNDRSVLENHHCSTGFRLLMRDEHFFVENLFQGTEGRGLWRKTREGMVEMILATDLGRHFEMLSMFKKKVMNLESFDPRGVPEDKALLMQMMLKCADVANPTKPWPLYTEWIQRVTAEWYEQGDEERRLGMPISPFCNREATAHVGVKRETREWERTFVSAHASSQKGFIEFIVAPIYEALGNVCGIEEVLEILEGNRGRWEGVGENGAGTGATGAGGKR